MPSHSPQSVPHGDTRCNLVGNPGFSLVVEPEFGKLPESAGIANPSIPANLWCIGAGPGAGFEFWLDDHVHRAAAHTPYVLAGGPSVV
jgi:hypothetical protein